MGFWKRLTQFVLWTLFQVDEPETVPQKLLDATPLVDVQRANGSCHTPTNRQCWIKGYGISTDYEKQTPTTGIIREVDGYNVSRMLFNKTYPGPLLEGDWGDTFRITVRNKLTNHNGTSIHWHGIRQLNTNWYDGVSGVTECPIPPGESFTYEWRATQYGVSWYHSHFSLQYPDGLVGPLKINGPTSMNYDYDLGPVLLTDHFHRTAFSTVQLEYLGRPPKPDSFLMNGNGTYQCCPAPNRNCDPNCIGKSKLTTFHFEKDHVYKMSLVNTATSTHMTFWIDGHVFYVVGTDFVPIVPYPSETINIAIGQRYDIIIVANASIETQTDFWIHARDCANGGARSNLGIIRYDPRSSAIPWTPPPSQKHICYGCLDELNANLVPKVSRTVPPPANNKYVKDSFKVHLVGYPDAYDNNSMMHKWVLKDSSLYLDWSQPSLSLLNIANEKEWDAPPFPQGYEPVWLNYTDGAWVWFLIEGKFNESISNVTRSIYKTQAPVAHPIHVHGHDFVVLASGDEEYDPSHPPPINCTNPPRRDVALLPVDGYLIIAFEINNPGAWLMHCHIAWHASGGLALQFIEKPRQLSKQFRKSSVQSKYAETCTNWGAYYSVYNKNNNAMQEDSGI